MTIPTSSEQHKKPIPPSIATIQNTNWSGCIPIVLTLAPSSLSSPTAPRSLHKLVPRASFLHVGLYHEIWELFRYAPTSYFGRGLHNNIGGGVVSREEPPDSPGVDDGETARGTSEGDESNEESSNKQLQSSSNEKKEGDSKKTEAIQNKPSFPECWFEDEESGTPLRWHLFVGVLYDLMKGTSKLSQHHSTSSGHQLFQHNNFLPWRLKLHFTSYPTEKLLPLGDAGLVTPANTSEHSDGGKSHNDIMESVAQSRITLHIARIFRNSLKQALFLQYGSSKVAMSISKHSHEKLWDAVLQSNYEIYHEVNRDLQKGVTAKNATSSSSIISTTATQAKPITPTKDGKNDAADSNMPQLIPVRVMVNGSPAIQKPCRVYSTRDPTAVKNPTAGEGDDAQEEEEEPITKLLSRISPKTRPFTTLGEVLADWLPHLFEMDSGVSGSATVISQSTTYYSIQGVQPSMSCNIVDLWRSLCHPDHFLYVIVVTS